MTLKEAIKRIAELERKVAALEARPLVEQHAYYHQPPSQPHPDLVPPPLWPGRFTDPYYSPWRPYTPWTLEVTSVGSTQSFGAQS